MISYNTLSPFLSGTRPFRILVRPRRVNEKTITGIYLRNQNSNSLQYLNRIGTLLCEQL